MLKVTQSDPAALQSSWVSGGGSPRILVVEDEEGLRSLMAETLLERQFQVITAADGVEALELLDRYPGIQLIFSDVLMPRMGGYELVEQALRGRPELKVVMVTAYATELPPPALLRAREIRTLHKPFDLDRLSSLANEMLSRP